MCEYLNKWCFCSIWNINRILHLKKYYDKILYKNIIKPTYIIIYPTEIIQNIILSENNFNYLILLITYITYRNLQWKKK